MLDDAELSEMADATLDHLREQLTSQAQALLRLRCSGLRAVCVCVRKTKRAHTRMPVCTRTCTHMHAHAHTPKSKNQ